MKTNIWSSFVWPLKTGFTVGGIPTCNLKYIMDQPILIQAIGPDRTSITIKSYKAGDIIANSVCQNEMADNKPSHLDLPWLPSCPSKPAEPLGLIRVFSLIL